MDFNERKIVLIVSLFEMASNAFNNEQIFLPNVLILNEEYPSVVRITEQ